MSIVLAPMKPLRPPHTDHVPQPYAGPSKAEALALRTQYLMPGLITYYRDPLMLVEGHMQYVWDESGKQYLDAFAGIVSVSVGHCHPEVVAGSASNWVGFSTPRRFMCIRPLASSRRSSRLTCRSPAAYRPATSPIPEAKPTNWLCCSPASTPATPT